MSIIDSIVSARKRGATEEEIIAEIIKQNPNKVSVFNEAKKRGATAGDIIREIVSQNKNISKQEEEKGYFGRVAEEYKKSGERIISGVESAAEQARTGIEKGDYLQTAIGYGRAGLRTIGGVAGAAFAPVMEAPIIRGGIEKASELISQIPGMDKVVSKAVEIQQKYPEAAKDIQDLLDVTAVVTGGKKSKVGKPLEKTGEALQKSARISKLTNKEKFVQKLIQPIETAKVKRDNVRRMIEKGKIFKKHVKEPNLSEQQLAREIMKVPGVNKKNTFQKNYNLIDKYNKQQAKQLEKDIFTYNFDVPENELYSKLDDVLVTLKDSPLIVGDAEKTAEKLINGFKKIFAEEEKTGVGLLKARKKYDNWLKEQMPKVFDANKESAITLANRQLRDTINNTLDDLATNLGIKDSLKQQSRLFRALEVVGDKAAVEGDNVIERLFQKSAKFLGTKNKAVQLLAAGLGITSLAALQKFAPAAATVGVTGASIYGAGKIIMSPQVRQAIGELLKDAGHLLNASDKALIIEILENTEER